MTFTRIPHQSAGRGLRLRRLASSALLATVVTGVAAVSAGGAEAIGHASSAASDATMAREINLESSDLPTSQHWSSAAPPAAQVALGRTALSCMKKAGGAGAKVSTDPFGTVGVPSGDVTADVSSKVFSIAGSFTALPSASSEVDVVTSTTQAHNDLLAFESSKVQACEATLQNAVVELSAGGKTTTTARSLSLPKLGDGGVHLQFVMTGGNIPGKLYEDIYYYLAGRAELTITFVNLATPFTASWASSILTSEMKRAVSIAK